MQITEHIHKICIPYNLKAKDNIILEKYINVYLLIGKRIILIDTGINGSEKIIFDYIEDIGRSVKEISHILLTHAHPEHTGAVSLIKEKTQCKVGLHVNEKEFLYDEGKKENYPFFNWDKYDYQKFEIDFLINDGDILDLDEKLRIKVIHTPGHTRGSVSFLLQQDNALFTGDAIPSSRTYPIFESWKEGIYSLEKIENLPYPKYILPSRDEFFMNESTQNYISSGIERFYEFYTIYSSMEKLNKSNSFIAEYIWRSLNLPIEEYHTNYEKILIQSFGSIKL